MTADPAERVPVPPKQDPETLVLRGRPRAVVRFRRGLIVGLAATTAIVISGVTFIALRPAALRITAPGDDSRSWSAERTPDALAKAPWGYGDVPRLGPPLPGDLGRPILDHQRALGDPSLPIREPALDAADRARAAVEAEHQRRAAEREAARTSSVLVQLANRGQPVSTAGEGPSAAPAAASSPATGKVAFAQAADGERNPNRRIDAPSPWMVSAGTIIPASLVTGLNSDLPGMVVAQITEAVRDSPTGRTVLIPQGARLIGQYDSAVAYGQRRALLVWQRIVFPDGSSITLDHMPATDAGGYAGVEDRVDFHTMRLIQGIALASLLGIGSELAQGGERGGLLGALRDSVQQNGSRAGDQLTQRNLDVQPTLRVRPGWPIRAIVNKDLILEPWEGR